MNNYQPQGSTSGGLINTGSAGWFPQPDDVSLLLQQESYALQCENYIGTVRAMKNGLDITSEAQRFYLRLMQSFPLTITQAVSYFPGVTSAYWSSGVMDYRAAFAAIISTSFPV